MNHSLSSLSTGTIAFVVYGERNLRWRLLLILMCQPETHWRISALLTKDSFFPLVLQRCLLWDFCFKNQCASSLHAAGLVNRDLDRENDILAAHMPVTERQSYHSYFRLDQRIIIQDIAWSEYGICGLLVRDWFCISGLHSFMITNTVL